MAPSDRPPRARAAGAVGQIRGVLAERVIVSTLLDPYLSLRALSAYSGLSRKTLLRLLARAESPIPHYRLTDAGKIVVRRSDFDTWMEQYRRTRSRLDELIEQRRHERAARRRQRLRNHTWT